MHQQQPDSASEVKRLQRCMNDLVSVLALPAVWSGSEPNRILETLLDALMEILDLDFLYGRVRLDSHKAQIETLRTTQLYSQEEVRQALNQWFGEEPQQWPEQVLRHLGGQEVSVFPVRMGIEGELGLIVAGSHRLGFPEQTESLVLGVAANQVAIEAQQDRRRAEEALRASEQKLSLIINTMPVLAWSARPDGAVEFFNQRWLDYTGLSPEQAQGWGWIETVHHDDLGRMTKYWQSMITTGGSGEIEARFRRFDGDYRWFLFRTDPMRDESGAIVKWYGTNTDIDDRKRAEEALRNTQAELARLMRVMTIGQLTASIAHEVSQPLSGIIMNASTCLRMLKSDPPNIDGARETVQRTIRDGNRASEVITRLRTLFSKKQIDVEPFDLNEATREVIALLSVELQRNNVTLKHEFSDQLPTVNGDRVQLQQVILNLIRNGSDAMGTVNDRPRQLVIRTETDGNHVTVSVQDSGVGFSPEIGERLFESFFTTKQEGMGIGLPLSRSIVEAHRGHLSAARNDGPGATFTFSIPCDSAIQIDSTP